MRLPILFLLAVNLIASEDPVKKATREADQAKLQGTWKVVSLVNSGEPVSAAKLKDARLIVETNKYTYKGEENYQGTFTLDSSATPRVVNATFVDKFGKEQGVAVGIYRLDGNRVTICWGELGEERRPKTFASVLNSGHRLIVLERADAK
jgi:uncharacterized protein (TIGR03067 family)